MDLWIRSQSRSRLIKATDVHLDYDTMIKCDKHIVADYSTTERALEVLDEIQKLLTPQVCELAKKIANNEYSDYNKLTNIYAIMDGTGTVNVSEISTVIYEMPKE
jgi:hypothetical protein